MIGEYIIAFDIAAIVITISLLIALYFKKLHTGRAGITFAVFMYIALATSVLDILSITAIFGRTFMFIINTLYFIFRIGTAFMCLLYMVTITDLLSKALKNKPMSISTLLPSFIFLIVMIFVNPFTGSVFRITENSEYVRGPLLWINYVVAAFYLAAGMFFTVKYRKIFSSKKKFCLYSVPVITIVSLIIQFFLPKCLIETFATSIIMILFMSLLIDDADVHSETGIGNYNAFIRDMTISLFSADERTVVVSLLENYTSLKNLISYEDMYSIIEQISLKVLGSTEKSMPYSKSYYIGKGMFATCLDFASKNKEMEFISKMDNSLVNFHIKNHYSLSLSLKNLIIKTPKDISDIDELERLFMYMADNSLPKGSILKYSDLLCSSDFIVEANMDSIIRKALRNQAIDVYYQPIVRLSDGKIVSAEALARLTDPEYGYISPALFIPYVERTGDISKIGYMVLEKTAEFIASDDFKNLGIEYIEVNLSPSQMLDPYLTDTFMDILNKYHISPNMINIEITESQNLFGNDIVDSNVKKFKELGFELSLDDYGTGYSNLKRFVNSPLSIVKIDKSMVDGYKDKRTKILLEDTIRLVHRLGMKIVCEGVETEECVNFFKDRGCDFVQGFYYSKALPLKEFTEFIKNATIMVEE